MTAHALPIEPSTLRNHHENLRVLMTARGGPEVLEVVREPIPEPGPGQVRVRVLASSAQLTDVHIRRGEYPMFRRLPYALGYDLVGEVDALGDGAAGLAIGDRVADMTILGSYARFVCRPAASLVPVSRTLDPAEATAIVMTYTTAYQMLHRVAGLREGDTALVRAAGGAVGRALLELARLAGVTVYATARAHHHDEIRRLGATPIDYERQDWVARVRELTGGRGVDAAFDPLADDGFRASFSLLARGGRLVAFGFQRSRGVRVPLAFARLAWWRLLPNGRRAGFYGVDTARKRHPDWFRDDLAHLFALRLAGDIRPRIADRMPLERAADAHRRIEAGALGGKIALVP